MLALPEKYKKLPQQYKKLPQQYKKLPHSAQGMEMLNLGIIYDSILTFRCVFANSAPSKVFLYQLK